MLELETATRAREAAGNRLLERARLVADMRGPMPANLPTSRVELELLIHLSLVRRLGRDHPDVAAFRSRRYPLEELRSIARANIAPGA